MGSDCSTGDMAMGTPKCSSSSIKGLTGDLKLREAEEEEATLPGPEEAGRRRSDVPDQKGQEEEEEDDGIEVCCFDNRGVAPCQPQNPTTRAMIACKLAAMSPERICSLALLSVTEGGYECFPKIDLQTLSLAIRFLRAKTPEERAIVDLETHYTKEYLDEYVGSCKRRNILYQEYVKALSSKGMQSAIGFEGQSNACWTHSLTSDELRTIHTSGFLVSVIHGRCDIVAQLEHARRLAEKLHPAAKMVELHAGHLVNHERSDEVNGALMDMIKSSKLKLKPAEWSSFAEKQSSWLVVGEQMPLAKRNNQGANPLLIMFKLLGKLPLSCIYFFGSFIMAWEHMKNSFNIMKPVRVAALDS